MTLTMAATPELDLSEILALWHGDQDSLGYWSAELVVAVCQHTQPINQLVLEQRIFPGIPSSDLDEHAKKIIGEGYRIWRLRRGIARRAA